MYLYLHTHTHTQIYIGVEFSGEEVIVLPLATIASLFIWIEVSATVERMYVNNSNCDS